ncbi:unnamed protein product [Coffea canephora]|uniref:DH200=94 genomic scaffold, scaffold_3453 n=1 Tax=Coffea canephora TaxID=49390 RepID=A0A068VNN3_COFCA|nr:unnamed protein product [Coffea canephora]
MADAVISATVEVVLETVISIAADRVGMVLGVKAELGRLSKTTATIQGFLADADAKVHSPGVRDWLKQLEDEVFKADNVLDELHYNNLRREVKYRNQLTKKKVCFLFSFFNAIGFNSSLASNIREINTNLERINQQANDLGLEIKYQIEAALPADAAGFSVIPITGMGGLGKTTLAKSVYNNTKIDENFGIKSWVCVARQIKIVELFKLILESLTRTKVEVDGREAIVQEIRGKLGEKRFLLVLDDVWNREQGLWSDFFTTLLGLSTTKGSWCILTTRLQPVANAVPRHLQVNDGPYSLGKLSDDACWSIIKRRANSTLPPSEEVPKELEAIQEQILRRCDGLPLAASLIGGLLLNNGKEKWHCIVQESLLNEDQSEIDQILKVSFDHLSPPSVKKCFAYCSIFPQDAELGEDELIRHWIAVGFVLKNNRVMEETGGEYLRILLQNCLLEKSGNQKSDNCDEDVLEGLQPHPNLQELKICSFMGNKFPQWLINLPKLVELRIQFCRCGELLALGQLPSLKRLYLTGLDNIRSIGDEFYGITTNEEKEEGRSRASGSSARRRKFFPALEELHVEYMENLAEWKDADQVRSTIGETEVDVFPMLRNFHIQRCPQLTTLACSCKILDVKYCRNLTSIKTGYDTASVEEFSINSCDNLRELPEDAFGSSLRRLTIEYCPRLICLGVNGQKCALPCLERLSIYYCDGLTTISNKMFKSCPSLQSLEVKCCRNLVSFSLNLRKTPSLERFLIINCPKLIPHRFKGFAFATSLRELSIGPFSSDYFSIDGFDWSGLRSASTLRELRLEGLPHTESLSHQLQYLTTLTSLRLASFGGIEVLPDWIGNLVSLEGLQLSNCKKLRSLPSKVAMRQLTKLPLVNIFDCPLLRQRYSSQRGIYLEEISSDAVRFSYLKFTFIYMCVCV